MTGTDTSRTLTTATSTPAHGDRPGDRQQARVHCPARQLDRWRRLPDPAAGDSGGPVRQSRDDRCVHRLAGDRHRDADVGWTGHALGRPPGQDQWRHRVLGVLDQRLGTAYKSTATDGALASAASDTVANIAVGVVLDKFGVSAARRRHRWHCHHRDHSHREGRRGKAVHNLPRMATTPLSGAEGDDQPRRREPPTPAGTVSRFTERDVADTAALSATLDDARTEHLDGDVRWDLGFRNRACQPGSGQPTRVSHGYAEPRHRGPGQPPGLGRSPFNSEDAYGNPVEETANTGLSFDALVRTVTSFRPTARQRPAPPRPARSPAVRRWGPST